MRLSAVLRLVVGVAVWCARAGAQDSTLSRAHRDSAIAAARPCTRFLSDGILVLSADTKAVGPAGEAYLARIALLIERRFAYTLLDSTPLIATFGAQVLATGAVADVRLLNGSGRAGFDMEGQRASSMTVGTPHLEPMPAGVPAPLRVLISFGRHRDGRGFVVSHISCPAVLRADNPQPKYPATTATRTTRTLRARFQVDTVGTVDSSSVTIDDQVSDAFLDAARAYVVSLRYFPAEFDGKLEEQWITKAVIFVPPGPPGEELR